MHTNHPVVRIDTAGGSICSQLWPLNLEEQTSMNLEVDTSSRKKNIQFLKFRSRTFDDLPNFILAMPFLEIADVPLKIYWFFDCARVGLPIPCSYMFSMSRIKSLHVFHGFPVFNG